MDDEPGKVTEFYPTGAKLTYKQRFRLFFRPKSMRQLAFIC
jgi:hypothetical protein